jgi:glyoxalase family protein
MVKKTVNFDDPNVYHFYFGGDLKGEVPGPGSIFTSFPYGKQLKDGRHGKGKINTTAFSLPQTSLDYWVQRLDQYHIAYKSPQQRFADEVFIYLEDPDGLGLELVFDSKENRPAAGLNPNIPAAHSIRGIHHVELWLDHFEKTAALLTTVMNHRLLQESAGRFRYAVDDLPGKYIDILWDINALKGLSGRGMVHHVAFATPDTKTQRKITEQLSAFGLEPTQVKDRKYFSSVYFTEPGGVIFEIATSGPGFTIDESPEALGRGLMLPDLFEWNRDYLTATLPAFDYEPGRFR